MNEESTVQDVVDDSWGEDIDLSDVSDEPGETPEEPADQAETGGEIEPAEKPEEPAAEPEEKPEANQNFELNYMGERRTVSKDEAISLAQKGMDYDRVRASRDETLAENATLKKTLSYMEELAKGQGMSLDEMIDGAHAALLAQKEGLSPEAARERVRLERRERELAMREEALKKQQTADTEKQAAEQKRLADIRAFAEKFPGVEPKSIPPEVWAEVNKGATLTEAYTGYENRQLKLQLEAERKNKENAARTAGSKTGEGENKIDPIDKYWYEDD